MTRTRLVIGALVVAVVVLGAVILGGIGKRNQQNLRADAVERMLPAELAKWLEDNDDSTSNVEHVGCVSQSETRMRCIATITGDDGRVDVPIRVTLDPDRGSFLWEAG